MTEKPLHPIRSIEFTCDKLAPIAIRVVDYGGKLIAEITARGDPVVIRCVRLDDGLKPILEAGSHLHIESLLEWPRELSPDETLTVFVRIQRKCRDTWAFYSNRPPTRISVMIGPDKFVFQPRKC